jgi:hypothetical protein
MIRKYICKFNRIGSDDPFVFLTQIKLSELEISFISGRVYPWKGKFIGRKAGRLKFMFVFYDKPTYDQFRKQLYKISVAVGELQSI